MKHVAGLLRAAAARLAAADPCGSARLDAEVLLAHSLECTRAWLYASGDVEPPPAALARFETLVARRVAGEPVGHLTGQREFWSLDLTVTADTLIPRPETEELVETVLGLDMPADARVLDLGTGSGAIALALASERPRWRLLAVDASPAALAVAQANAARLQLTNVVFVRSDWFDGVPAAARFSLIVSNPPYVAEDDAHLGQGDLRFEPRSALVAGADGLDAIRRIVARAPGHLAAGGWLWLEHGAGQADAVGSLLGQQGFDGIACHTDLAGLARISGGRHGNETAAITLDRQGFSAQH
jgi:release factor glutamine methyltransferase